MLAAVVNTCVGIDLEQAIQVAGQAVGDRIGGSIQIEGIGRDTDGRTNRYVLVYLVNCIVGIGRCGNVELVDVIDCDIERLSGR